MLSPISIMADRLGDYISDLYLQYFAHRSPEYAAYMGGAARLVLETDGFEVVGESATGLDGVSDAARLKPQIVLLDIGLPDIDGIEVAHRITTAAGASAPAVVLISSRDGVGYERAFADCGARGFIPKADLSGDAITALAA